MSGAPVRPAPGDLLLQRLRTLAVGRHPLPAARGPGLLQESGARTRHPAARTRKPLATGEINPAIVERYYQTRAIRRIAEAFERDHDRKALVVMATGAGKTRTVIALADLLMRCNWAKRILFLADRVALVNQA
ncbi:Restriction endonuclease, type I, R subunit/Type III, Res subunit [mine drainage metagenome]|uniref:Restriction endonuclease, type I, R subunit/Type III, Res subunit n=1 Tax=mine drainage metagenome TaxID=410659 RepID=T1CS73_9ZZZZ